MFEVSGFRCVWKSFEAPVFTQLVPEVAVVEIVLAAWLQQHGSCHGASQYDKNGTHDPAMSSGFLLTPPQRDVSMRRVRYRTKTERVAYPPLRCRPAKDGLVPLTAFGVLAIGRGTAGAGRQDLAPVLDLHIGIVRPARHARIGVGDRRGRGNVIAHIALLAVRHIALRKSSK